MVKPLPSELSDRIVDYLASNRAALASCSLVCKNWVGRSRRHLFKTIKLCCGSDDNKLPDFVGVLRGSPDVALCILHLTLSNYREPNSGYPEYQRGIVIPLLEVLPALQSLSLEDVRLNLVHTADIDLSSTVKTLSIKESEFENILRFHHFVCAFPALDDLTIGPDVSWSEWEETGVVEGCTFAIDRLQIGADDVAESPLTWISLLHSIEVETLCINAMPWYFIDAKESWVSAWGACIPSVRSLELDLRHFNGNEEAEGSAPLLSDSDIIDLSKATLLHNITATVDAWRFPEGVSGFVHLILPTCSQDMHLESCTILVEDGERYNEEEDTGFDEDHCSQELGKVWADDLSSGEYPSFDGIRIPSEFLTMRLIHPLKWNEQLYERTRAIWSAGVPLRLEHTTIEGAIHAYVPLRDN